MRQKADPRWQKPLIEGERTAGPEGVDEDGGDAVPVDGRVEHARLHHVQRLRKDGGGGAGEARRRQVRRQTVRHEEWKDQLGFEDVVEPDLMICEAVRFIYD